jgi:hypothetical protein
MPAEIKITIDEDGNCKAEGIGFIGAECDRALREIDQALGTRTKTTRKPEYARLGNAQQEKRIQANG